MKKGLFLALYFFISAYSFAQVICVDAGHGYGPAGENSDGRTYEEITTNCEVALRLDTLLTKMGYSVILTRNNSNAGSWMTLTQRAELADNYESERLLSIHCNGGGGTGTESFWCYRNSPNKAIDSIFSGIVQSQMVEKCDWHDRRSIEDFEYLSFHLGVLKGATPGCLNEIGFVDTPSDLTKLLDSTWRDKFAEAYASAIEMSFHVDYPSTVSFTEISGFQVFPIPFTESIHITLNKWAEGKTVYTLATIDGRIMKTIMDENSLPASDFQISTDELPAGLYILIIQNKNFNRNFKIVKL